MTAANGIRKTPLHSAHRRAGARMVAFAGWDMPIQYEGILVEHRAVRERAGLFDVSHMGEVEIRGPGAADAMQRLVTNDVRRLKPGQAQYAVLCDETGGIVDDVIYSCLADDRFLVCVNAANRDKDVAWIRSRSGGSEVVDRSDELALLALQGPQAREILTPLADFDVRGLGRFAVTEGTVADVAVIASHTGYTGEDGWELYASADRVLDLWYRLLEAGAVAGLMPAGLGARDTLRLEAGLLLYGQDMDEDTSPLEAGLGWVVRFDKGPFIGREALLARRDQGLERQLVGLETGGGPAPRHGYPVRSRERIVGRVTSGTRSPTLGHGIALAYVASDALEGNEPLAIEVRGRPLPAQRVRPPFYRLASRVSSSGGGT